MAVAVSIFVALVTACVNVGPPSAELAACNTEQSKGQSGRPEKLRGQKIFVKRIFSLNGIITEKYSCSKVQNQKDEGTRIIKICPLPLIACSNQQ